MGPKKQAINFLCDVIAKVEKLSIVLASVTGIGSLI